MKILPDEFVQHFLVANKYAFRGKALFYCFKTIVLYAYADEDGYDLQKFWKYKHFWAQFYHYDMQWEYNKSVPPEVYLNDLIDKWNKNIAATEGDYCFAEMYDDGLRMGTDESLVRCKSEHHHILGRWILHTSERAYVFHCPTDQFYYRAFPNGFRGELIKQSPAYAEYAAQCKGTVMTVGDEDVPKGEPFIKPFSSFKWLLRYARSNMPDVYRKLKYEIQQPHPA